MFVAIACDFSSDDHKTKGEEIILQYGFKKIMDNLFESTTISANYLVRMKRELDGVTDSYDTLRFYQYPVDNTLVITYLKEKKWRRLVVKL